MRAATATAVLALSTLACPVLAQPAPTGLQKGVVFKVVTPPSGNAEIARRAISPLTAARLAAKLRDAHAALAEQSIDLSKERFVLYVPQAAPAKGYGVIVFVPPWPDALAPREWIPVLDAAGVIFVSAAASGNDQTTLGRREPLAVLAATNVVLRYPVNTDRIYVAGLSGGSRVAMKIALGWPDLFRGAILNAGSDPVGGTETPLPPRELMQLVQERSGFVYLTGGEDAPVLADDAASQASLRAACVFNLDVEALPGMGHDLAPPFALKRALSLLDAAPKPDATRLAACRAEVDREIAGKLGAAEALLAAGQRAKALAALDELDRRWGGLAAPRSVELFEQARDPNRRQQAPAPGQSPG